MERASARGRTISIPDGWDVDTDHEVFAVQSDQITIRVDPTILHTAGRMESLQVDVPEPQANCYSVTFVEPVGSAGGCPSEVISFEDCGDAIEFVQYAALYTEHSAKREGFVSCDFMPNHAHPRVWQPDGIVTDIPPREAAIGLLNVYSAVLEDALEQLPDDSDTRKEPPVA